MNEEINLRDIARRVADGEYDVYLRNRYVGKRLRKSLSGYLNGVKKTIALLLYAADKDWVRLTDATRDLYISRSSAHKLLRRKLIEEGYVEVVKEGKRMKYRLTDKGKELAKKLAEELASISPEALKRKSIFDEIDEERRQRAKEIEEKAKLPADVHVRREE